LRSPPRLDPISAHTIAAETEAGRLVILDVVGMPIPERDDVGQAKFDLNNRHTKPQRSCVIAPKKGGERPAIVGVR
jgi:hypothetical protein